MLCSLPKLVSQIRQGALGLLLFGFASVLLAQSSAANKGQAVEASSDKADTENSSKDKLRPRPQFSPEREAAVLTFVHLHHAELEALLIHLREARPKEYDKAIRELFRATERLGQIQDRDQELYELELRLWKTQSRLQLLLARLQMGESSELKAKVRETVQEQFEVKLAMLQRQEKRLSEQALKTQQELAKMQADRTKWVDRQVNMLTRPKSATTNSDPAQSSSVDAVEDEKVADPSGAGKTAGKNPERQDDEQLKKEGPKK